ncbi:MAG: radical SAM protein [Candidatus Shapirobacteria bacterium]
MNDGLEVKKEVSWSKQIRLLVNKKCNYNCSFPGSCREWCHKDGVRTGKMDRIPKVTVEDFLFFADAVRIPFGIEKVKVGAMEPLLYPGIFDLISGLKKIGYKEVSMTTNGYFLQKNLDKLEKTGLDTLTVSMHAFNKEAYRSITRIDGFDMVKNAVEEATKRKFTKVKVNRVLLKVDDLWGDLMRFFDWAVANKVRVKLYKLIWSPEMDSKKYFDNYVSWKGLMVFLRKNGKLKGIDSFTIAGRQRFLWELNNGLEIETDVFGHKLGEEMSSICRKCSLAQYCQEGLLSYGIEVNPDLVVSPCLLRDDVNLDLYSLIKERDGERLRSKLSQYIDKIANR